MSPERAMFRTPTLSLKRHPIVLFHNADNLHELFKNQRSQDAIKHTLKAASEIPEFRDDIADSIPELPDDTASFVEDICNAREKNRARNLEHKNSHKLPSPFHVSQLVLKKVKVKSTAPGVPFALKARWTGPYIITSLGHKYVEILHLAQGYRTIASADDLKPYYQNLEAFQLAPDWAGELDKLPPPKWNREHQQLL
jgi:hypothetical protein